jgi:hypothetical protein
VVVDEGNRLTRRTVVGALGSAGALSLVGCTEMFPYRYRFRMTIEIDTPQGLRTGSGVMEVVTSRWTFTWPNDSAGLNARFQGEAIPIDLPGGTMFALVGLGNGGGSIFPSVASSFERRMDRFDRYPSLTIAKRLAGWGALGRKAELKDRPFVERATTNGPGTNYYDARTQLPMFVRFRDIMKPETVEQVDPYNLSKVFGPGVRLRRIMLEIVNDEVTTGIGKRLPWLATIPGGLVQLPPGRSELEGPLAWRLLYYDFYQGTKL